MTKRNEIEIEDSDFWYEVEHITNWLTNTICSDLKERCLYQMLLWRTISIEGLIGKLPTDEIMHSLMCSRKTAYIVKSNLVKRNVIIKLPHKEYCINIVGLIKVWVNILKDCYPDRLDYINTVLKRAVQEMINNKAFFIPRLVSINTKKLEEFRLYMNNLYNKGRSRRNE